MNARPNNFIVSLIIAIYSKILRESLTIRDKMPIE